MRSFSVSMALAFVKGRLPWLGMAGENLRIAVLNV
jgi:hypothetical protein